jgi:hypothetical protein
MGTFKIEITAVGNHCVDRSKREGQVVDFEDGGNGTPDALAAKFVEELQATGCVVESARIIHWPGNPTSVSDDLITGIRTGSV